MQSHLSRTPPTRHRPLFRPHLEALEDRTVPTITVTQAPGSPLITITGDAAPDFVVITDSGSNAAGAITVFGSGLPALFTSSAVPAGQVIQVQILTGSGRDTVRYTLTGNLGASTGGRSIFGFLGNGNDIFRLIATNDVDVAAGVVLNVNVNGGNDADRLTAAYHGEADGNVSVSLNGGGGIFNANDRLFIGMAFDAGSTGFAAAQTVGGTGNDFCSVFAVKVDADPLVISAQIFGNVGFDTGLRTDNVLSFGVEDSTIV